MIERVCDLVARATGVDPAEVRRRNFIQPDDFPYDTGVGMLPYDSGNYEGALDRALERSATRVACRAETPPMTQASKAARDRPLNRTSRSAASRRRNGSVSHGEGWGAGLWESANVKVHLTGKVVVTTGSQPHGQGHETTFAQLVSDDSAFPTTTSSRALAIRSARRSDTAPTAAASLSVGGTAHPQERRQGQGQGEEARGSHARGERRRHRLRERQMLRHGMPERSKRSRKSRSPRSVAYDLPAGWSRSWMRRPTMIPPNCTFPFGTHICVVEIDRDTGQVDSDPLRRGRRCRQRPQPADRGRPDPWRHRAGNGPGALRGRAYNDDGQLVTGS